jgi:hypothetical protein
MPVTPSRRIVLEDITTPANERATRPANDPHPSRQPRTLAGATGNLIFLAGVWLVISGFSLFYRDTGVIDAYWNDVVVGIALGTVALVGIVKPTGTGSLTLTKIALGGWLVVAPFALSYSEAPYASRAFWNDIVVGVIVLALAVVGMVNAAETGEAPDVP